MKKCVFVNQIIYVESKNAIIISYIKSSQKKFGGVVSSPSIFDIFWYIEDISTIFFEKKSLISSNATITSHSELYQCQILKIMKMSVHPIGLTTVQWVSERQTYV